VGLLNNTKKEDRNMGTLSRWNDAFLEDTADAITLSYNEDETGHKPAKQAREIAPKKAYSRPFSGGYGRVNPELLGVQIQIQGGIERLHCQNPDFSAGKIELVKSSADKVGMSKISFSGKFLAPDIGEPTILVGRFEDSGQYGIQFKAETFLEVFGSGGGNMSIEGLANYLATSKKFHGIGPAKAKILAAKYGSNFGGALEDRLEEMAETAKIPLDAMIEVREAWRSSSNYNDVAVYLSAYGLTSNQIQKIIETYKGGARRIVTENPYIMIQQIDGFGFSRVDDIALKMGILKDNPNRLKAALGYIVSQSASGEGHTWIPKASLIEQADKMLCLDRHDARAIITNALEAATRPTEEESNAIPLLIEFEANGTPAIADSWLYYQEMDVIKWLKQFSESRFDSPVTKQILNINPDLNDIQRQAVIMAVRNRISVITGAAGVGKTFCIAEIIKLFQASGIDKIALAAPTGKAARRITQSIADYGIKGRVDVTAKGSDEWGNIVKTETLYLEGQTIHKMLGFSSLGWMYNSENLHPAKVLIVDEMSMCDIPLLWRLLQAFDPKHTSIILVGDQNQLPPVGPGSPLRDIIARKKIPVTQLTQVVRQSGELKAKCTAILEGIVSKTGKEERDENSHDKRQWFVISKKNLQEQEDCAKMLYKIMDENISNLRIDGRAPDLLRDVQVITPTHKGELGTVALNHALQRALQNKLYGVTTRTIPENSKQKRPDFLEGDKVIQTKNDYSLGIMNGTIGYIKAIKQGKKNEEVLSILFEDATEAIDISGEKRNNISHAYALTIHKMQGSEVPIVIAVVHKAHSFQTHRNMIYTAATRAKNIVILIGEPWGMAKAAEKQVLDSRLTLMSIM